MISSISFTILSLPIPKARARVGKYGAYTPKRTKKYEAKVRAMALVARQKARQRCWTGPVGMEVMFYVKDPKKRPDCDNLLKTVLDACKGVIFEDDAQLTDITARKLPLCKTFKNNMDRILFGGPQTVVTFWKIDGGEVNS